MKTAVGSASWPRSTRSGSDPRALQYGGGILAGTAAVLAIAYSFFPGIEALPALATALFVLAAAAAFAAWLRPQARDGRVTLWDVAGALAFIGIAVSALIAPEHLVQILEGRRG